MARDFKIELDNVEMINGSDDLLKDTKVNCVKWALTLIVCVPWNTLFRFIKSSLLTSSFPMMKTAL